MFAKVARIRSIRRRISPDRIIIVVVTLAGSSINPDNLAGVPERIVIIRSPAHLSIVNSWRGVRGEHSLLLNDRTSDSRFVLHVTISGRYTCNRYMCRTLSLCRYDLRHVNPLSNYLRFLPRVPRCLPLQFRLTTQEL